MDNNISNSDNIILDEKITIENNGNNVENNDDENDIKSENNVENGNINEHKIRRKKISKVKWSKNTMKLFFKALKLYSIDFIKIEEYIKKNDTSLNISNKDIIKQFNIIYNKTKKYVQKYINYKKDKLNKELYKNLLNNYFNEDNLNRDDQLYVVLAYGELYLNDLLPKQPRAHNVKKIYDFILNGNLKFNKNSISYNISIPKVKIITNNDNINNSTKMERIIIELRPRSLSVLILMRQRAYSPYIRLNAPIDIKVGDLVVKLYDYWRISLEYIKNNMTLFVLDDNTKNVVRNLLSNEYLVDLKKKDEEYIQIFYDINSLSLPNFNEGILTCLSLKYISILAKMHISLEESQPIFKKPDDISSIYRPVNKITSLDQIRKNTFKPSRIRIKSKKNISNNDNILNDKRRIALIPLKSSLKQLNNNTINPSLNKNELLSTSENNNEIINNTYSNIGQDTNSFNAFIDKIPFDKKNNDTQSSINFNLLDNNSLISNINQPIPNLINEDSNFGFLMHFSEKKPITNQIITNIDQNSTQFVDHDNMPFTQNHLSKLLETPKFDLTNTNTIEQIPSEITPRRLFTNPKS